MPPAESKKKYTLAFVMRATLAEMRELNIGRQLELFGRQLELFIEFPFRLLWDIVIVVTAICLEVVWIAFLFSTVVGAILVLIFFPLEAFLLPLCLIPLLLVPLWPETKGEPVSGSINEVVVENTAVKKNFDTYKKVGTKKEIELVEENKKHKESSITLMDVIASEKVRLHNQMNEFDASVKLGIEKMKPIINFLEALKIELGKVDGLKIDAADAGHVATVSVQGHTLSVSMNVNNTKFMVEERSYFSFSGESFEKEHFIDSEEDVKSLILSLVGKHMASQEVAKERNEGSYKGAPPVKRA